MMAEEDPLLSVSQVVARLAGSHVTVDRVHRWMYDGYRRGYRRIYLLFRQRRPRTQCFIKLSDLKTFLQKTGIDEVTP